MKSLLTLLISSTLFLGATTVSADNQKGKGKARGDEISTEAGNPGKDGGADKAKATKDDDSDSDSDSAAGTKNGANGAGKGNEQSQEMRDRRDERKAIQEEYRGEREPGQEGRDKDGEKAEKKPWYKFWD